MKKEIICLIVLACFAQGAWAYSSGDGSARSPYTIANKSDLQRFVRDVNDGRMGVYYNASDPLAETKGDMYGYHFKLTADITYDGTENNYTPAGTYTRVSSSLTVFVKDYYFCGTFDGDGHTISGINVTSGDSRIGIFGYVRNATIKNLVVANSYFSGSSDVGAIVGQGVYTGTIENCRVKSDVTVEAWQEAGGIIGWGSEATLNGCASEATVNCQSKNAGGLAGNIVSGSQNDCLYLGNNVTCPSYAGALTGFWSNLSLSNCYYTSTALNALGNNTSSTAFRVDPIATSNAYGNALKTYPGGIIVFANGIQYDGNFYSFLSAVEGSGTQNEPYIIPSATIWNQMGSCINNSNFSDNKYFKLAQYITVSTSWGTSTYPFKGHFDGNTKTLTANLSTSDINEAAAPFKHISGASSTSYDEAIKDLVVEGTISGGINTAGLVGHVHGGQAIINNCRISADITCTGNSSNNAHGGGIVGHGGSANVFLEGCLFNGSITAVSNDKGDIFVGAMIGWCTNADDQTISHCMEDGTYTGCSNLNLIYDERASNNITGYINGTFHKTPGISQGTLAAYTFKSGNPLLTFEINVPKHTYGVAGFSTYGNAIIYYDDTFYIKPETKVQLIVSVADGYTLETLYVNGTECTYDDFYEIFYFTMPSADAILTASILASGWEGDGTAESPWLIYIPEHLRLIGIRVNSGLGDDHAANGYDGKYFKVMADLEFDGRTNNHVPIGNIDHKFQGHFDGNGHAISHINISTQESYNGLFGATGSKATVTGIILHNTSITSNSYNGGIVGRNEGTITNCHVLGSVTLKACANNSFYFGGIAGFSYGGTIDNCTSGATLSSKASTSSYYTPCHYYGGIAGAVNYGTVTNNIFFGTINSRNIRDAILTPAQTVKKTSNCFYTNGGLSSKNGLLAPKDDIDNTSFLEILTARTTFFAQNGHEDLAGIDFTLNDRTLYKDGTWNTLTLPFDLKISGSVLNGATARTLTSASFESPTLTLNFGEPVETMTAGTPYIIKWQEGKAAKDDITYTVTASNQWNNNTFSANNLFDFENMDETTCYVSYCYDANEGYKPESNASWYVAFKTSSPLTVIGYTLRTPGEYIDGFYSIKNLPKTWTLSAKLNESDEWTVIDRVADGQLPETPLATKSYDIKNVGTYQYFLFNASEISHRDEYWYGTGYHLMMLKHLWLNVAGDPLESPTFKNVAVSTADLVDKEEPDIVTFTGTYAPVIIDKEDKKTLFLGANNLLYHPSGNAPTNINAFRGFFLLGGDIEAGLPFVGDYAVKSFVMRFEGEGEESHEATGIGLEIPMANDHDTPVSGWYDLTGRKLHTAPTSKGIYIHDGKKITVK